MEWAAIFDWDGVIVDSSRQHEESWEQLAEAEGLPLFDGHFERSFGMKNQRIIPEVLEWTRDPAEIDRLSLRKETMYRDIVKRTGIEPLPGVKAWLSALHEHGVPCVVGTSTDRANVHMLLDMLGLGDAFCGMITSEDVSHGKPDPEVFLKAADLVGIVPARCVVFEDAPVGIEAAHAGGMKAVGVTSTRPAETLAGAECVVGRLDELRVRDLERILDPTFEHPPS